ncbi:MAG TPA: hypothetical protein VFX70_04415 [Mycobacteriales bacterium]|nr:hypothetical protein [Mycobacteriales bacterium]
MEDTDRSATGESDGSTCQIPELVPDVCCRRPAQLVDVTDRVLGCAAASRATGQFVSQRPWTRCLRQDLKGQTPHRRKVKGCELTIVFEQLDPSPLDVRGEAYTVLIGKLSKIECNQATVPVGRIVHDSARGYVPFLCRVVAKHPN